MSSLAVGSDGNIIVSFRNLNTIVSMKADGSGPQWVVSSSFEKHTLRQTFDDDVTLFEFENDADKFYQSHSVMQLSDGSLLMMDDGNDRPGCTISDNYAGCFSRAMILWLDFDNEKVRATWQFEDPYKIADLTKYGEESAGLTKEKAGEAAWSEVMTHDQFNWDGGSAYKLDDGHIVVAFTSVYNNRHYNANYSMYAWEVDQGSGDVRNTVIVPHGYSAMQSSGGYRMIPWNSIGGEGSVTPAEHR